MEKSDLLIWNLATIRIVSVKHGLLTKRSVSELCENSSFVFVRGRNGHIVIEDAPYSLSASELFHVAPDKLIEIEAQDTEVEYFIVAYQAELPPSAGQQLIAQFLQRNPFRITIPCKMKNPAFFSARFERMMDLWGIESALSPMELKAVFYAIIHRFLAESTEEANTPPRLDTAAYASQYLRHRYQDPVSIQELADSLGIPRSTLHERFRRQMGMSPQQYLMQLRLDAAHRALLQGDMSIDEVAICCGLRDKSYLSRVFKKKYGISPGRFRTIAATEETIESTPSVEESKLEQNRFPVKVENMGRIHRYYDAPRRIVCLDYSAAEMCAALGVADRLVGVASAESALSDCAAKYRDEIAQAPFLPAKSDCGVPDFSTVCDREPELVIGTSYSFRRFGGVADAEAFEQRGIHIYAMTATYVLHSNFESIYEDLRNFGRIFHREARAEELVQAMKVREATLRAETEREETPLRVFSFSAAVADRALTCGQSLEDAMIRAAGGVNIFSDRERQFVPVTWEEVAALNPQVILVHCSHTQEDGRQKIQLLKRIQEIASTEAIQKNRFLPIGIKKVFPSIDCVETAYTLAEVFREIRQQNPTNI